MTAKDFAIEEVNEIIGMCDDLKYINNKELTNEAIYGIDLLSRRILKHLEYWNIKDGREK